jgi:hypothetical protein
VREALNEAMVEEMTRDPNVFVLGEEVCWPCCNAGKLTSMSLGRAIPGQSDARGCIDSFTRRA